MERENRRRWSRRAAIVAGVALGLGSVAWALPKVFPTVYGRRTIDDRLAQYGPAARARLRAACGPRGVAYPPAQVVLVALKRERVMHVFAAGGVGAEPRHVLTYPIRGASGTTGPKLREGDRQVPEGVYGVESLNPNSRFHLSLRVDYPNAFDRKMAAADGRAALGSDIMIHGGSASVGCLAMGDEAAEDLFVLAADTGIPNVRVILAPCDLRARPAPAGTDSPAWVGTLYESLGAELKRLPLPGGTD